MGRVRAARRRAVSEETEHTEQKSAFGTDSIDGEN